jgi:hypothetical protein
MALAVGGTLIIAVPMKDGIVVSSDSRRGCGASWHIDGIQKIRFLRDRIDFAFFATNRTLFLEKLPPNTEMTDWYINGRKKYDVIEVINQYLSNINPVAVNESCVNQVAEYCASHLKHALASDQFIDLPQPGQSIPIYQVGLIQVNQNTRRVLGGKFVIRLAGRNEVAISDKELISLSGQEPFTYWPFGETAFLESHVLSGVGRRLASARSITLSQNISRKPIRKISRTDAMWYSRDLIDVAIKTSSIVNPETQIGGEVFTYYINGRDNPATLGTTPLGHVKFPEEHLEPSTERLDRQG